MEKPWIEWCSFVRDIRWRVHRRCRRPNQPMALYHQPMSPTTDLNSLYFPFEILIPAVLPFITWFSVTVKSVMFGFLIDGKAGDVYPDEKPTTSDPRDTDKAAKTYCKHTYKIGWLKHQERKQWLECWFQINIDLWKCTFCYWILGRHCKRHMCVSSH